MRTVCSWSCQALARAANVSATTNSRSGLWYRSAPAGCRSHDLFGDAAHEKVLDGFAAMRAHHNQINAVGSWRIEQSAPPGHSTSR